MEISFVVAAKEVCKGFFVFMRACCYVFNKDKYMGIEAVSAYFNIENPNRRGSQVMGQRAVELAGEPFLLHEDVFSSEQVERMKKTSYHLGTGHRQFFGFDRYPETIIMTDNAHNCLAGLCMLDKGIFVFHDPPMKISRAKLSPPRGKIKEKIIGGALDYWRATQAMYERECGSGFQYIQKPEGHSENVDYSFAFVIDMAQRTVTYGYYYNPKGISGDGWIWD